MILDDLKYIETYTSLSEEIAIALRWAAQQAKETFEKNTIELVPQKVIAQCEEVAMTPREKLMLEAHHRFIFIHVPISGEESMGWSSIENVKNKMAEYDEDNDIIFYGDAPQRVFHIHPGQFAIFFPEDAHAPNIGIGNHKKLCIKIAID